MSEAQVQALEALSSPVRRDLLDALANLPVLAPAGQPNRTRGLTAAALAQRVDLHVTTVRFHLDRLAQAGLVESHDERLGVGRPRRHWTARQGHFDELQRADSYHLLAAVLADAMAAGDAPTAEEAGRRWAVGHAGELLGEESTTTPPARTPGTWLAKVGAVVDVLDRYGYAPSVTTEDAGRTACLRLHRCPLRELAASNPAVACGVHRGIIAGTLEALGEPGAGVRLAPFVEPDLCIARVTTPTPFHDRPHPSSERP